VLRSNICEKINYYENQSLYDEMRARQSRSDFYKWLSQAVGYALLHIRIGLGRIGAAHIKRILKLLEERQDKSKITINPLVFKMTE